MLPKFVERAMLESIAIPGTAILTVLPPDGKVAMASCRSVPPKRAHAAAAKAMKLYNLPVSMLAWILALRYCRDPGSEDCDVVYAVCVSALLKGNPKTRKTYAAMLKQKETPVLSVELAPEGVKIILGGVVQ